MILESIENEKPKQLSAHKLPVGDSTGQECEFMRSRTLIVCKNSGNNPGHNPGRHTRMVAKITALALSLGGCAAKSLDETSELEGQIIEEQRLQARVRSATLRKFREGGAISGTWRKIPTVNQSSKNAGECAVEAIVVGQNAISTRIQVSRTATFLVTSSQLADTQSNSGVRVDQGELINFDKTIDSTTLTFDKTNNKVVTELLIGNTATFIFSTVAKDEAHSVDVSLRTLNNLYNSLEEC